MSRDQKVMTLLPSMEKCPMDLTSINELLLLPKFNNSSPSVTRDKKIVKVTLLWAGHSYYTSLGKRLGLEKQYKPSPFDKKFKNQA